jgi:hypothetical protein
MNYPKENLKKIEILLIPFLLQSYFHVILKGIKTP